MAPKVSVLVGTYDCARHVRAAIESVLAQQTTFPFEIVIADDASTDGTREIVEDYARAHPELVRLSLRPYRVADGGARNILEGLARCTGEYVASIDGDDVWIDPDKLQHQVEFLDEHPSYQLCFHACRVVYDDDPGEEWEMRYVPLGDRVTTDAMLKDALLQTSTMMLRRTLAHELQRWPEMLSDWFIGILASERGGAGYIDRVMSVYRQAAVGSFSSLSRADQWAKVTRRYERIEGIIGTASHETVEQAICVRSYLTSVEYEREGKLDRALPYLRRALASKPDWLAPFATCYGLTGEELLRTLHVRARLYEYPPLFFLWSTVRNVLSSFSWRWLEATLPLRAHVRLQLRRSVGTIVASPNPARARARNPYCSAVDLLWTSAATDAVEVRIGRPDGLLLSRTGPSGGMSTDAWVADGTVFFLQDVDGVPLTKAHTLAAVRVAVRRWIPASQRARHPDTRESTPASASA